MMMPDGNMAAEVILDTYGEYLLARLEAKKELGALKEAFQPQQEVLRKRLDAQRAMERAVQHALAARDDADMALDDAVRRFALAILSANHNNRKSPDFVKYFPKGLTAVTLAPLAEELVGVGKILDLLASEPNPALKAFASAISQAATALMAGMDGYAGADAAAVNAANATRAQGLLWRDAYRKIYGELLTLYPGDKPFVESFFKKGAKPKKGAGSGGTAPTGNDSIPKPPTSKA